MSLFFLSFYYQYNFLTSWDGFGGGWIVNICVLYFFFKCCGIIILTLSGYR